MINKKAVEPSPPISMEKLAEHHWLDEYDCDGHFFERIVLQWNPFVKKWSHSGSVATGVYVDTTHWKYVGHCKMPD